jgi:hypothetical protein
MQNTAGPDLAPITRLLRAVYGSRLLIAAVHHFKIFELFTGGPQSIPELQAQLGLKERPAMVLFPALCAMGLLKFGASGELSPTELGRYLMSTSTTNLTAYVGLEGNDAGVLEMVERLKNDGPLDAPEGIAYVKEGNEPSPMDNQDTARFLTLGLSGRARHLSPVVAQALPKIEGHLLDVAGGTGLFTYEWLLANPKGTATVFDRPHVLEVAAEFLDEFCKGGRNSADTVRQRVKLLPGDMLEDELPRSDLLLAASLFHDWPTATCEKLARRFAAALNPGGELWVHDAFLDDTLDGPLAVTDYSAQLFWVTKGRCYSRQEYRRWLADAGLASTENNIPTLMDYGLISALKPN